MARKKSKKVNIFFVILMVAILGYFYYKFDASQSLQSKDDPKEIVNIKTFPDDIVVEKESLISKPTWYKEINIEYPKGDVVGVADIASFAKEKADKFWCLNDEENLTEAQSKKKADKAMYECSLEIKYSYTFSNKLFTHKLVIYGSGGVHGIYSIETFTYDTDGNKLALVDLVANKENYKKIISDKLKIGFNEYQKNNPNTNFDSSIEEIIIEENIDTLPYVATKDGLVFLFNETNGLSNEDGEVEIKIPKNELIGIIKSEFLN
ncbi:DUF3298 domain-containing protein [Candidatus Nomurabacteria bacterium]|nr:DUF3298 domain-containing protein [Candidatus Nomurabacteria bacterium]